MPFSNYTDAVNYLYAALPMFQRVGAAALKKDLGNTIRLCEALGNPQLKFKSVHVAGTNGKGSVSHMIASILQSSGYKTGLYTSPHLKSFTERIRINGDEIDQAYVVDFVNRIQGQIELVKPSFFEITVVMAFDYFVHKGVDIAVIEVGMGGRLDSTNVITPEVSVITNIGNDHKELLGDTLEKIASEKAGIIKRGVPVVISEYQPEVFEVFLQTAHRLDADLTRAFEKYSCSIKGNVMGVSFGDEVLFANLDLPLKGDYQVRNIPAVLSACEVLDRRGFRITRQQIKDGLMKVTQQTGLKGRWQILGMNPLVVCDTGHNIDGIRWIVKQLERQTYDNLFIVMGVVKDKDPTEVLQILPRGAYYYFCQANIPRAMEASELFNQAATHGLLGEVVPEVRQAIKRAKSAATPRDMIFIGGSTFVVAEIEEL